jgi:hypothetical protein
MQDMMWSESPIQEQGLEKLKWQRNSQIERALHIAIIVGYSM